MTEGNEIWNIIFRKKPEIVCRAIAGETILVPISGKLADMQRIFSLNPAAEHIWNQLNGERTFQEIRNSVLSSFDVPENQADADIEEFIDALLKENLIVSQEYHAYGVHKYNDTSQQ